ncbi:hypothetical protein YC2023_008570 [Brassica napus]
MGNKIHASCKKAYFDRLENKVPVDAWRNIDHFLVTNNGGSYKTTNHQYKIVFIPTTDITPSTLQEENMFLSLVDFESIQSGKLDTTNLIDVIGQVFELGDLETVQCHDKAKGKQPQCSKRFRANGDYNNKSAQFSNIISRRSSCLKIQPTNLLPAFSKADIAKQQNSKVRTTSQHNETEDELDITSVTHNLYEEGDDYSDQSYDVSSEDSDSYEVATGNTGKKMEEVLYQMNKGLGF